MPHDILNQMVFTFHQKLANEDITNVAKIELGLEHFIKGIKCFNGIEVEDVPTFKFIQFRKSFINDIYNSNEHQVMLIFNDMSQKILYDTSKAEGELLSLINSTMSHEMRNPLNSIINQCKIITSFVLS